MRTRTPIALLFAATLALAACGGDAGTGGDGSGATTVDLVAGDLFFEHDGTSTQDGDLTVEAAAGELTINLDNEGSTLHNVIIEEEGDAKVAEAEGGESDSGSIELETGTYTFYCDVEQHREVGMEGTLEVG